MIHGNSLEAATGRTGGKTQLLCNKAFPPSDYCDITAKNFTLLGYFR